MHRACARIAEAPIGLAREPDVALAAHELGRRGRHPLREALEVEGARAPVHEHVLPSLRVQSAVEDGQPRRHDRQHRGGSRIPEDGCKRLRIEVRRVAKPRAGSRRVQDFEAAHEAIGRLTPADEPGSTIRLDEEVGHAARSLDAAAPAPLRERLDRAPGTSTKVVTPASRAPAPKRVPAQLGGLGEGREPMRSASPAEKSARDASGTVGARSALDGRGEAGGAGQCPLRPDEAASLIVTALAGPAPACSWPRRARTFAPAEAREFPGIRALLGPAAQARP